ncbi:MAG: hypothetical protein WC121_10925 [Candidatus Kapaibacterium sp.]
MNEDSIQGVTPSEVELAKLCNKLFFSPWTCNNPHKKDKKELCDFISIFDNEVFLFFVREKYMKPDGDDKQILIDWKRWEKKVISKQADSLKGAERYIRQGNPIYTDNQATNLFNVSYDYKNLKFHKIIIAYGAKEACETMSNDNIYGSLAIKYEDDNDLGYDFPFGISLDKSSKIHVFDSFNLDIILNELDTIDDFRRYLNTKEAAIDYYDVLAFMGEEDLLAIYLLNERDLIREDETVNVIMIEEGTWQNFVQSDLYLRRHISNKPSYLWDRLISYSVDNYIPVNGFDNKVLTNVDNAIKEMSKVPRYIRREYSNKMIQAIESFPNHEGDFHAKTILFSADIEEKAYVFMQVNHRNSNLSLIERRSIRTKNLLIACKHAKLKHHNLRIVVGIAMEAPKYNNYNSEDFCYMEFDKNTKINIPDDELNESIFSSKGRKYRIYDLPRE